MTGYRDKAWQVIEKMLAENGKAQTRHGHLPDDTELRQQLRRERLEITDRLINLASLDDLDQPLPHPPVPEQAATPEQAAWIRENSDLWEGWQFGCWPAHDDLDPRGYRWEAMP